MKYIWRFLAIALPVMAVGFFVVRAGAVYAKDKEHSGWNEPKSNNTLAANNSRHDKDDDKDHDKDDDKDECKPGQGFGDDDCHTGPPGRSNFPDDCKPGHGFGDKNHEHCGPPGRSNFPDDDHHHHDYSFWFKAWEKWFAANWRHWLNRG